MNLQQTIEELGKQARQYRQVADQLRALATVDTSAPGAAASRPTTARKTRGGNTSATGTSPGKARKARKTKQVSAETRAKISEKLKPLTPPGRQWRPLQHPLRHLHHPLKTSLHQLDLPQSQSAFPFREAL
jgi:hypothetical protein